MASGMYPRTIGTILATRAVQLIDGSSRKEYVVSVAAAGDNAFTVVGSWGRIGSVNQHKVYAGNVPADTAIAEANTLLQSKITRGYGPAHAHITLADLRGEPVNIVAPIGDAIPAQPLADMLFT